MQVPSHFVAFSSLFGNKMPQSLSHNKALAAQVLSRLYCFHVDGLSRAKAKTNIQEYCTTAKTMTN